MNRGYYGDTPANTEFVAWGVRFKGPKKVNSDVSPWYLFQGRLRF